jgi:hypothetical protein
MYFVQFHLSAPHTAQRRHFFRVKAFLFDLDIIELESATLSSHKKAQTTHRSFPILLMS